MASLATEFLIDKLMQTQLPDQAAPSLKGNIKDGITDSDNLQTSFLEELLAFQNTPALENGTATISPPPTLITEHADKAIEVLRKVKIDPAVINIDSNVELPVEDDVILSDVVDIQTAPDQPLNEMVYQELTLALQPQIISEKVIEKQLYDDKLTQLVSEKTESNIESQLIQLIDEAKPKARIQNVDIRDKTTEKTEASEPIAISQPQATMRTANPEQPPQITETPKPTPSKPVAITKKEGEAQPPLLTLTTSAIEAKAVVAAPLDPFAVITKNDKLTAQPGPIQFAFGHHTNAQGDQHLKIHLLPPELGHIRVDLKVDGVTGDKTVSMSFSIASTHDLFKDNTQSLQQMLMRAGYDVQSDQITLHHPGEELRDNLENFFAQQQQHEKSPKRKWNEGAEEEEIDDPQFTNINRLMNISA